MKKAKDCARQGALAGGKYALEMQSSDQAKRSAAKEKAMDRSKYWVYRKGSEGAEFEGFDQGEFVDLNKFELNELIMNPEFESSLNSLMVLIVCLFWKNALKVRTLEMSGIHILMTSFFNRR